MEKIKDILIECAKIYNRVWREALGKRDYDEVSMEETEKIEDKAHEEIRDFLDGKSVEDWEFVDAYCNCSEVPFPRDDAMIGVQASSGRGIFAPGVRIGDRIVCLCCGAIH